MRNSISINQLMKKDMQGILSFFFLNKRNVQILIFQVCNQYFYKLFLYTALHIYKQVCLVLNFFVCGGGPICFGWYFDSLLLYRYIALAWLDIHSYYSSFVLYYLQLHLYIYYDKYTTFLIWIQNVRAVLYMYCCHQDMAVPPLLAWC